MTKQTKTILAVLLAVLALSLAAWFFLRPIGASGKKTVTVTVRHLNGTETAVTLTTEREYLRGALEDAGLASGRETQYGLYLLTVDGETADETKRQWWGYTVNETDAAYGVETQPIADGDRIVFTLHEGW